MSRLGHVGQEHQSRDLPKVAGFRALCGPVLQIPVCNVANFGMSDSSVCD